MTRTLIAVAAFLTLSVSVALAVPPADKGKPENPGNSQSASGQSAEKNAAKKCKAERKAMGLQAFKNEYGTNANKANAFGKCVSKQAKKAEKQDAEELDEARENAAKECKAERESMGLQAFKNEYGTNANKANAFGKCVSGKVKKQTS